MKTRKIRALFAIALLGIASVAAAAPAPTSNVELRIESATEQEYVNERGEKAKRLVPVTRVIPGDEVVYTIHFVNKGKEPATDVVITNPIPAQMAYREGTAFGTGTAIEFSVDGGRSYGASAALRVRGEDGRERAATAADYTHVRWRMQNAVPGGQSGFVRYRAVLK
jgi:uncharacterized repeat protein (TIGR01451 family)